MEPISTDKFGPPPPFRELEHLLPESGSALELACGRGRGAIWLARRGLDYFGVDISPVAIDLARSLVAREGLEEKCRFAVHDLDEGLPDGPGVDLVFCYLFRDPSLDQEIMGRLRPEGTLAIACLSEVGHGPGSFRVKPGELSSAFASLDTLEAGEGDGLAWLLARMGRGNA